MQPNIFAIYYLENIKLMHATQLNVKHKYINKI